MAFDVQAARSSGYSDGEIASFLAEQNKFDLPAAQKAGYEPAEIIDFLSAPKAAAKAPSTAKVPESPGPQDMTRPAGMLRQDITAPQRAQAELEAEGPSFLSTVADKAGTLIKGVAATNPILGRALSIAQGPQPEKKIGSVLEGKQMPDVPFDAAEAERLSRRDYAEDQEQRQRVARSPEMRETRAPILSDRQRFAEQNPVTAGFAQSAASTLAGTLNVPAVAAGLVGETANRMAQSMGVEQPASRVGNMPLVDDLRSVGQEYASQLSRKAPGQAWDDGEFGRWIMTQLSGNSFSAAQSLGALFVPGAQASLLASMGGIAAGGAYAEGDSASAAAMKGLVEVGSEMLPLKAAEKIKDVVLAIPSPARNQVLAEAGKRLLAAGTAVTTNSMVGAIEEVAAEIGGNAIDKFVSGKDKSLFADVDRAAIVGAAFGTAFSGPAVTGALEGPRANRARELAAVLRDAGADPQQIERTVAETLRTEDASGASISPVATSVSAGQAQQVRQQQAVAQIGAAQNVDEAIAAAVQGVAAPARPAEQPIATPQVAPSASTEDLIARIRELEGQAAPSVDAAIAQAQGAVNGNDRLASSAPIEATGTSQSAGIETPAVIPEQRQGGIEPAAQRVQAVREGGGPANQPSNTQPALRTADPATLLALSRNPTSPLATEAATELRRRETDYVYEQRAQQERTLRQREERALLDEFTDQQIAQSQAVDGARQVETPNAMQLAMQRARSGQTTQAEPQRQVAQRPVPAGQASQYALTTSLNPSGTLTIRGGGQDIRQRLVDAGISGVLSTRNGLVVPRGQSVAAQRAVEQINMDLREQQQSDSQAARAQFREAERKRTAGGNAARSNATQANPFKAFIAKHGISLDQRREFAPGVTEQRKAMVQGYGPIFRKSGQPLDKLASMAVDEGFLSSPDEAELYNMITDAINGTRIIPQYTADGAQTEMESRIARQQEYEQEAADALADLSDGEIFDLEDSDIVFTADSNISSADFLRSLGASEQEIADELENERQAENATRGTGPEETSSGQAQGTDRRGEGETGSVDDLQFSAADATNTPAFAKWFGDSKVVDANGKPLVVYHGTTQNFDAFNVDNIGDNFGVDKTGFFFTSSPVGASGYADPQSQFAAAGLKGGREVAPKSGANVIPVYLSIQNPLTLEAYVRAIDSSTEVEIDGENISITDFFDGTRGAATAYAKDRGFDGVIFERNGETLAVAFDPAQIKSATGNRGTYDPANPDIRYSNQETANDSDFPTIGMPDAPAAPDRSSYAPASTAHTELAQTLLTRLRRSLPNVSIRAVDPAEGVAGQEMQATRMMAKRLFRRDVVFVEFDGKALFNGVVSDAIPGVVFLNAESTKPHMAVLGHELLHQLRADNPALYDRLSKSLDSMIKDDSVYARDLSRRYEAMGMSLPKEWREELHADIVGDHFTDPQFWLDIAAEQPSMFQRVAQSIRQFLNRVLVKAKPFGTDRFLTDVEAARDAVTQAMREFSQDQVRSEGRQTDGVAMSASDARSDEGAQFSAADMSETADWQMPDLNRLDKVLYEGQDSRVDLRRTQEAIKQAGRQIEERFDARTAETLYAGRVAYRSQQFLEAEAKPLLQAMTLSKVSMDELADYLHARGAEERNAQIARVNPDMPDGGAGTNSKGVLLTNQAAQEYLASVPADRRKVLDALAKRVDAITKGTRELLVNEGIEKREVVDAWEAAYKNYVPMFRDEAESGELRGGGGGFNVRGANSQRATGSTKQVTNILAHVLMQREAAITRAEKNRVGMALYGLALTNPNKEVWTTIRPEMKAAEIAADLKAMGVDPVVAEAGMSGIPTIRTVDPITNTVVDRVNPMYKNLPGAIVLKVGGEDRVLLLNEKNDRALRMAQSLKNLDGLTNFDLAGSIVGRTTRWLAAVNTQYNPAFGIVNGIRDTFGGAINLTSTPLKGQSTKVLVDAYTKAGPGIVAAMRGNMSNPWAKLYEQFQEDGGKTGYRDLFRTAEDRTKAIESELKDLDAQGKLTPRKAANAVFDLLDNFNTAIENAVRLSAYSAALDSGLSRPQAAKLARELTVDFNRKGRMGRELGPLYAFFNASVQGTARTVEALQGPAGAKIIAGGLALGAIQSLLLALAGFDEDEVPEFIKARALIIPNIFSKEKQFIAIPLPLGLHVIPNTGRVIADLAMSGGRDASKKAFDAVGEIAGAMSPLGGGNIFTADGALRTALPTVLDPIAEIGFNKNFAGSAIEKESRGEGDIRPGFARVKESTQRSVTGQAYIGISKALNKASGGSDYEAGLASPSPEIVQYVAHVAGGGLLREIEKIINISGASARGDKVPTSRIPILGRLYGEVDPDAVDRSRYFESNKKVMKAQAALKAAAKAGDADAVQKMYEERPELLVASGQSRINRSIADLNKLAISTVDDPQQLRDIDQARYAYMRALNDSIKAAEEMTGKGDTPRKKLQRLVKREPETAQ